MRHTAGDWMNGIARGALDAVFSAMYGADVVEEQCARYLALFQRFSDTFGGAREAVLVSAPGRTEISGNHTDHQNGRVLAAAVTLDCIAVAAPNGESCVRIRSDGFPPVSVSLVSLLPEVSARGTSAALVRGMASGLQAEGVPIRGFDAVVDSTVPVGAGLSSSAAFEMLIGQCMIALFGGETDALRLAHCGREAERVHFGKPCGGMDQTASALGGALLIDFLEPDHPKIVRVPCDLAKMHLALCLVDTGGSHADLTAEYAVIPEDMRRIAARFGKPVLREVDPTAFLRMLPALRGESDRAVLRAMHFFDENARVCDAANALRHTDARSFLHTVRESGHSSLALLGNVCSADSAERGVALALALTERFFPAHGVAADAFACRVHGGGFAGTIQVFLPAELLRQYRAYMEPVFGAGKCHAACIRPVGVKTLRY